MNSIPTEPLLIPGMRPPVVARYERRGPSPARRFATALAVAVGLLVLSAGPADARPVPDEDNGIRVTCTVKLVWPISRQVCFESKR
jgi:hypothetical protein